MEFFASFGIFMAGLGVFFFGLGVLWWCAIYKEVKMKETEKGN